MAQPPLVIGHRGAPLALPENTIPSLLQAISLGADGVEFDVRVTRDGELVLRHDGDVGGVPVEALTRAQVGERVGRAPPTLAEALEALPRNAVAFVEYKYSGSLAELDAIDRVASTVLDAGPRPGLVVISFDPLVLLRLHALSPSLALGQLVGSRRMHDPRVLFRRARSHLAWLLLSYDLLGTDLHRQAQSAGLSVALWTVDQAAELDRCAASPARVGAVITNDPGGARARWRR